MKLAIAAALALVASSVPALAQCFDNTYPVTLVDAHGNPKPTFVEDGHSFAQYSNDQVYLALDPATPSGTYVYQVSDVPILTLLSLDLLVDRQIVVTNNAGVIDLAHVSGNPALPPFGVGLGGVGESIPLFPFSTPPLTSPTCRFKAWLTDSYVYDPATEPYGSVYGPQRGFNPETGECAVRSYAFFAIGDGSGGSVSGMVFEDLNGNGVQDPGEPGLPGIEVCVDNGVDEVCRETNPFGHYRFPRLACDSYLIEIHVPAGYHATTPTSFVEEICSCGDEEMPDVGLVPDAPVSCDGKTKGFWGNKNGKEIILAGNFLSVLPSLNLVDANGNPFATTDYAVYKSWLQGANAVNMAYMLSAQLVAMKFNVLSGGVSEECEVSIGGDSMSIGELIDAAVDALAEDGYTPSGDAHRAHQEVLKNALDAANNNQNWL